MSTKTVRSQVLLPEDLWEEAKTRAVKDRDSFSGIVRKALEKYLRGAARGGTGGRRAPARR